MNIFIPFFRGTTLLLFASLLGLTSCKKEAPKKAIVVRPIKMTTVGEASKGGKLEFPGRIKAASEATLSFEVNGQLKELLVKEGDKVKKGTALAKLDARDYSAKHEETLAEQREAKARYDRAKQLFANDSISKQDLDVDRRAYDVAAARLKTSQKGVEDTILRAPFDGIVAKRFVDNFEQIRAKQDVIFFHAEEGLELEVDIPERIMRRYGSSSRAPDEEKSATSKFHPVVLVDGIETPIDSEFREIASAADPVTRTFAVKLSFEKPEGETILPGMSAKAVIDVSGAGKDVMLRIPAQAIVGTKEKKPAVYLVDKKSMTVKRQEVEVGKMAENEIIVIKGVSPGDTVALSGLDQLRDGKKVTEYSRSQKK